jgi:hypothetical protein
LAKLISSPNLVRMNPTGFNPRLEQEPLWESKLNGGMISSYDPQNLDNGQFPLLKNMVTRFDHTSRRNGAKLFTPAKPNANKILGWFLYQKGDGSEKLIRLTRNTIHAASAGAWVALGGGVLTGSDSDKWRTTILEDRMFATNNGADVIQEIDIVGNVYTNLGNAPKYKYIAGFGDRVVGFFLAGGVPVATQLGWSGNRNYAQWNPLVDQSAGSKVLTTSASDSGDFASGIFSFGSVLVLVRNKSIWEATLQPIAQDPFNVYQRVPNIGSDAPDSIAKTPAGIVFADSRTSGIYVYSLGGGIEVISDPVKSDIFNSITDPTLLFGSYNQTTREFSLGVGSDISTLVREWTYNFDNKSWAYNEYDSISIIANLDYASGGITIDDLVGTIDALVGTIDNLAPGKSSTKFYGRTDGELLFDSTTVDTDNSVAFTSEMRSKDFTLPSKKRYINRLHIEYLPRLAGNMSVYFSKDGGVTWNFWKTVNFGSLDLNTYKEIVCKKNIFCRRFMFKVESTAGNFELIKYAIYGDDSGESVNK